MHVCVSAVIQSMPLSSSVSVPLPILDQARGLVRLLSRPRLCFAIFLFPRPPSLVIVLKTSVNWATFESDLLLSDQST